MATAYRQRTKRKTRYAARILVRHAKNWKDSRFRIRRTAKKGVNATAQLPDERGDRIDSLNVSAQLDDLRNMKDGWYEGDGFAPSHEGLDWLDAAFPREYDHRLPLPRIYPTFDGGAQLEWMIGQNDASLEVDFSERSGYWHNLNLDTDKDEERLLNLGDSGEWGWLNARLRRLMESAE